MTFVKELQKWMMMRIMSWVLWDNICIHRNVLCPNWWELHCVRGCCLGNSVMLMLWVLTMSTTVYQDCRNFNYINGWFIQPSRALLSGCICLGLCLFVYETEEDHCCLSVCLSGLLCAVSQSNMYPGPSWLKTTSSTDPFPPPLSLLPKPPLGYQNKFERCSFSSEKRFLSADWFPVPLWMSLFSM